MRNLRKLITDLGHHRFPQPARGQSFKGTDGVSCCLELAYCLHPELPVARRVLVEAARELFVTELPRQDKRPAPTQRPVVERLDDLWALFQISIFRVSECWEKDQESPEPRHSPWYTPTASVMLTRFVKFLVFRTMLAPDSVPMALALGRCLFTYRRKALICNFWKTVTEEPRTNLQRLEQRLHQALAGRFAHAGRFHGQLIATKAPTLDEPALVNQAMAVGTPWGTDCFRKNDPAPRISRLLGLSTRQRKHALLCPTCAGLERLVEEWNASRTAQSVDRLPTPLKMLRVPMFPNIPPAPGRYDDHFDPPGTDNELEELRLSLVDELCSSRRRRCANLFQQFRVCLDDQEQLQFARGARALPPFTVPAGALCVQVFGQDAEGEVPLGVFYLPDLEAGAAAPRLYLVLESGATLALTVAPVAAPDGEVTASQVTLQFWEEEALVPKTAQWYEAALAAAWRSLDLAQATGDTSWEADAQARLNIWLQAAAAVASPQAPDATARTAVSSPALTDRLVKWVSSFWLPPGVGQPVTAAKIPEQTQVFYLEDGTIQIACDWRAAAQDTPATMRIAWRANLSTPSDLWVRFTRPDTATPLAEVRLGTALAGEEIFTQATLGFDPARESWALAVILREPPP